jgi:hypothetical protein
MAVALLALLEGRDPNALPDDTKRAVGWELAACSWLERRGRGPLQKTVRFSPGLPRK